MSKLTTIIKDGEYITLVPMGGPGYAIKGTSAKLGDVLDGPHYYSKDYPDMGTLASDIVTGKVQWIFTEGQDDEGTG